VTRKKPKKLSDYQKYEQGKRLLESLNLTSKEYTKAILSLAKRFNV